MNDQENAWLVLDEPDEAIIEREPDLEAHERFRYDQYDWTAAGFNPDYAVIRLGAKEGSNRPRSRHSGVYFAVVSKARFALPEIGSVPWYPLVEYHRNEYGEKLDSIKRVSAHRNMREGHKRQVEYLHRTITGARNRLTPVDHRGEGPLDNRDEALHVVNIVANNYTVRRKRKTGLLPGVDWRSPPYKTHVVGVIVINGKRFRSEQFWPLQDQKLAHEWYLAERDKVLKRLKIPRVWKNSLASPSPLVFPPLKKRFYFISKPRFTGEEIPF